MSEEMIASLGITEEIARHTMRGLNHSGLAARARSFQVVPGSSSSLVMDSSSLSHAALVSAIRALRAARSVSPALADNCPMIPLATLAASPTIPTVTALVKPIRSGFRST